MPLIETMLNITWIIMLPQALIHQVFLPLTRSRKILLLPYPMIIMYWMTSPRVTSQRDYLQWMTTHISHTPTYLPLKTLMWDLRLIQITAVPLIQITAVPLMICDAELSSGHPFPYESQVLLMSVFYTSAVSTLFLFYFQRACNSWLCCLHSKY